MYIFTLIPFVVNMNAAISNATTVVTLLESCPDLNTSSAREKRLISSKLGQLGQCSLKDIKNGIHIYSTEIRDGNGRTANDVNPLRPLASWDERLLLLYAVNRALFKIPPGKTHSREFSPVLSIPVGACETYPWEETKSGQLKLQPICFVLNGFAPNVEGEFGQFEKLYHRRKSVVVVWK